MIWFYRGNGHLIELTDVSKLYFGDVAVLDRVHLRIEKGEFLYLVGGSGAGKSTLLRLIATEENPTRGVVSLFGYNLAKAAPSTLRAIRRSIGYVPQDIRLIPDLSIYENVAISLTLSGARVLNAQCKQRIEEVLEAMGLNKKRNKRCEAISGGEAQRVAVARALVRNPELIIADEPTGAQDRDFTWALMELFVRSNMKGTTVVLATHDREIVRKVRKGCATLKNGKLQLEEGPCLYSS